MAGQQSHAVLNRLQQEQNKVDNKARLFKQQRSDARDQRLKERREKNELMFQN